MPADNLAAWLHGVDDLRVEPYNEQVRTELNARADMQPCATSSTGAAAVRQSTTIAMQHNCFSMAAQDLT
jgi:hypothetical protein